MGKRSKKHKYLAAMVALSLMAGGVAEAWEHQDVPYGEYKVFDLIYFDAEDKGDWVQEYFWPKNCEEHETFNYNFSTEMKSWLETACRQWAEILKPGLANMKNPAQLIVGSDNQVNAFANNKDIVHDDEKYVDKNYFKAVLTDSADLDYIDFSEKNKDEYDNNYEKRGYHGFAIITIGQGMGAHTGKDIYGWTGGINSQNSHLAAAENLTADMFHEIAHAMGIFVACKGNENLKDNLLNTTGGFFFNKLADDPLDYNSHLLDENGNKAESGKIIISPDEKKDDGSLQYTPEQVEIIKAHPEKYFQISSAHERNGDCYKGYAFFKGDHVREVMEGKTFVGNNNNVVDGIPILGIEYGNLDMSHIELERSLMSHQNYCSYNTFMEAELALMQDIGYNIDRKNFYGRSFYNSDLKGKDGINTNGFFARNEAGTDYLYGQPNTSTLGVGLHVYGSRNEITQTSNGANDGSADLLACGLAGAGIRIDGVENKVTLANDASIEANGQNGTGILVAYGRDHDVIVEGNVSALGDGGDAVRFDFGNGMNESNDYRGSYIRYRVNKNGNGYITSPDDMEIQGSENISLTENLKDGSFSDTEKGDLGSQMGTLTVKGTLAGNSHAVYIAKNAFVDNINIENGARIYGDIVSDWKHFGSGLYDGGWGEDKKGEKLKIQYKVKDVDKTHYYDEYCKDLVTNLNIKGDFTYGGNITGSDNMKLNVLNGATMNYTGTADVVSVKVAKGASLFGGNYKLNTSLESVDPEAGKLINHGTIGAIDWNSNMNIYGNLDNDGTLKGYAGTELGNIMVSGKAVLDAGSKITVDNGIHGETVNILQAEGGIVGIENVSSQRSGLLDYEAFLTSDRKSLNATAYAKESLDGATSQQAQDYENINKNALSMAQNDPGVAKELRIFYALESDAKALEVIDELGGIDKGDGSDKKAGSTATNDNKVRFKGREDSATAILSAQASSLNGRVLSSRLATAMGQAPSMLHIGASNLTAVDNTAVADIPVQLPQEQDNSAWIRYGRNWGNTASGSSFTGNTYTIGYDWRHGDNQRNGWFASYTDSSYGHNDGSENLQDTRIGYYTGINRGADTMLLYADYGYLDGSRSRIVELKKLGTTNIVKGDYTGWLVELGGEWKHALHEPGTKTWQVSPYGAMQMSYMKQHGYSEEGSMKACNVSGGNNFYSALEGGVEFSRYMPNGSLNLRLGLRQAITGTNYEAWEKRRYINRPETSGSISSPMDKTHFVTSMAVETELAPCWQLGAEVAFQKGAHDKDLMANVQLRWLW